MRPVLLSWRGRSLHAYRVFLGAGLVVFVELLIAKAQAEGLPIFRMVLLGAALGATGLCGARLLYVAINWIEFRRHLGRIARREGGAAVLGGVVLSMAIAPLLSAALGLPIARTLDMVALAALPAVAVGRVGCLLHGCCAGLPSDGRLAVRLRSGARHRPVPAFESALTLALVSGLIVGVPTGSTQPGTIFLLAAGGYSLIHFLLYFSRPHEVRIGGLATMQLLALAVCVACGTAWALTST